MDEMRRAVDVIRGARSLALACHIGPDGDALGSMLALHHLCRDQGVASIASWSEPFHVADHYGFLPGLDLATKPADYPEHPDVMVTFDCGSIDRLGDLRPAAESARDDGELIVVDHHATNSRYGTVNVVDAEAAATAVVVRRMAAELGWPLTRDAALCLYTGLVTDTGRFQYSNTTPEVFALAEELAEFDLPIAPITRTLFEEHRFAYLQLVGACLERAQLDAEIAFAATWVTQADLDRYHVAIDETEGLIDLLRRAREADVTAVLKEVPEGTRVSLRSVTQADVGEIATAFGGGGHRYAAGFTDARPVAEVLGDIRAAVARQRATADAGAGSAG